MIDFGAVKEVSTQLLDNTEQSAFTIGIGTKGYAPREQCLGRPQYSSDIYALGMIGIKALTGISPHALLRNVDGHLMWTHKAWARPTFAAILNKMIQEDPQKRYQSTVEVLEVLNQLIDAENTNGLITDKLAQNFTISANYHSENDDTNTSTTPWTNSLDDKIDSSCSTSINEEN